MEVATMASHSFPVTGMKLSHRLLHALHLLPCSNPLYLLHISLPLSVALSPPTSPALGSDPLLSTLTNLPPALAPNAASFPWYVKPPIFTLCVGNAWGEAALLLAASAKGNRSALPSSTIMIKQPIGKFQGQATDVDLMGKEVKNVKIKLYSKHTGKSLEQIEADIRQPKYFSPSEAVEYGIIDKVLYNERGSEDRGVVSDLRKAQLI